MISKFAIKAMNQLLGLIESGSAKIESCEFKNLPYYEPKKTGYKFSIEIKYVNSKKKSAQKSASKRRTTGKVRNLPRL